MTAEKQPQKSLVLQPGLKTETHTIIDTYDNLVNSFGNRTVGASFTDTSYNIAGCLASIQISRLNGGQGCATITVTNAISSQVWGLQMREIQKPIKTWKADEKSDPPNLTQIQNWEKQKDLGNLNAYGDYKYDGKTKMTGNTLLLAQMIRKGIQYYSLYTPIITCTERFPQSELSSHLPTLKDIGKIGTPSGHPFKDLTHQFLKTSDTLQGALDGTYTRTQSWAGAEAWDTNLYPSSTSAS
jgi:hypothetical protein